MANTIFRGDAKAVAQVIKITPANVEPGDVFSLTINGKSVEYTAESASVADVVDGLVEAWNASTVPEHSEITAAAVDSDEDGDGDYLTLTADTPGVPFEVTASATDAGGFSIEVSTITEGDPGQNEIQRVSIPSATSGGTFTLTFEGQTTAAIAYDANAAAVQTALEALSNIASGDVEVTGDSPTWTIEFKQAYANTNVAAITGSGASLTGAASLTINTTTEGAPGTNEIQSFNSADQLTAGDIQEEGLFTFITESFEGTVFSNWCSVNATASEIQTAIENLLDNADGNGTGNILVTRTGTTGNYTWTIEFVGALGQQIIDSAFLQIASPDLTVVNLDTDQEGSATAVNEIQTVRINGAPTGGTFTLSFQGQTTAGIAFDASAAIVEAALEALSNIDDVTVSKSGTTYTITFGGTLAGTDVGQLTGSASSLTGGAVSVATTQEAIATENEVQRIAFSQTPSGGTFTLTWNAETTAAIDYDATASEVQTALEGLTTPAPGDFSVSGAAGGPWLVEFTGTYAATDVSAITGTSSLSGSGTQSLTLETTQRSLGPAHFDDPTNWTNARVPDSGNTLYFASGRQDCLYGLKQKTTFTADASSDVLTLAGPVHFVDDQIVQVVSSDTLPAGLSAATNYYVIDSDRDAGTLKLSASSGGAAVNITDAGTGTHTLAVVLTKLVQDSRYTGKIGLPERNANGSYYEYRPTYLAIAATTVELGGGDGSGSGRIKLDTGPFAAAITIYDTGGGADTGLPAVMWKGSSASSDVTVLEGEMGSAILATESAVIDALVIRSGAVFLGTVTIGSIERTGGELLAENVTLNGSLQIRG